MSCFQIFFDYEERTVQFGDNPETRFDRENYGWIRDFIPKPKF
jgi:hypothetical protein